MTRHEAPGSDVGSGAPRFASPSTGSGAWLPPCLLWPPVIRHVHVAGPHPTRALHARQGSCTHGWPLRSSRGRCPRADSPGDVHRGYASLTVVAMELGVVELVLLLVVPVCVVVAFVASAPLRNRIPRRYETQGDLAAYLALDTSLVGPLSAEEVDEEVRRIIHEQLDVPQSYRAGLRCIDMGIYSSHEDSPRKAVPEWGQPGRPPSPRLPVSGR